MLNPILWKTKRENKSLVFVLNTAMKNIKFILFAPCFLIALSGCSQNQMDTYNKLTPQEERVLLKKATDAALADEISIYWEIRGHYQEGIRIMESIFVDDAMHRFTIQLTNSTRIAAGRVLMMK